MKNLSLYGIIGGIALFLFPFIFSNSLLYQAVNAKIFFLYLVFIIFAIFFTRYALSNKDFYKTVFSKRYLLISVLILSLIYIVASISGVNLIKSIFSDISRSTGMFFVISLVAFSYISSILFKKEDWNFVFKSIVFSSVIISLFNIFSTIFFKDTGNFFSSSGKLLGNSTFAGTFFFFGISFSLLFAFKNIKNKKVFYTYALLAIVQLLNSNIINYDFLTGKLAISSILSNPLLILGEAQASSATALLVAFLAFVFYILVRYLPEKKYKKVVSIISVSTLVLVCFSFVMLFVGGSRIQKEYVQNSSDARLIVWNSSMKAFSERPVLGFGPENFDIAIQKHIDPKLFLTKDQKEVWFDRAHNLFIDTLIEVGVIGMIGWFVLYFFLIRTFMLSYKKSLISYQEFIFLCIVILGNILQLQTSFHNINTYLYLFILIGYGLYFEKLMFSTNTKLSLNVKRILAFLSVLIVITTFYIFLIKERSRQHDLFNVFQGVDIETKGKYIENFSSGGYSFESIRISSMGMVKGLLIQIGNKSISQTGIENAKKELDFYAKSYRNFIVKNPDHYRAKIDLAYIYFVQTILGDNKINEANDLIKDSYRLSPNNPINYQMEALALMYKGKLNEAEKKSKEGLDLNPEIMLSQNIYKHILENKKTFPEITFITLENL